MKKLFIVGNWKSNKTIKETEQWLHDFNQAYQRENLMLDNKEIIVSPSFTLFEDARYCLDNLKLPIKLAAQNISPFDEGQYTGEVNARQIKEVADYVIIGHSERRRYFAEDEKTINKKISLAQKYAVMSILCVSDLQQVRNSKFQIHTSNYIIAYEPLLAIGSGNPDTPEKADSIGKEIKQTLGEIPVLYGGSVTSENVKNYTKMPNIDGILVGGSSLNPLEFLEIVKNA